MKRILFTGGGTAGHVIVNTALIPSFQEKGYEVDYIGSYEGIEKDLIEEMEKVNYYGISTGKLRRYMSKENIKDPFKVAKGIIQALSILRKRKPGVIFSKGGFVSVPVVIAAKLARIPVLIHESDYTPGLANKLSFPFADRILTTFPETLEHVPEKKSEYIGAVIRDELFRGDVAKAKLLTGFREDKPVLLVMGGSSGSGKINEAIRTNLEELLKKYNIIHLCGKGHKDESYSEKGYVQYEYVTDELKDLLEFSDLVVSRAGSNAIFEFVALEKPMLLIPLSRRVSRGDQILNSQSFERQGFAHTLEEEQVTGESFLEAIRRLDEDQDNLRDRMKKYEVEKSKEHVIELLERYEKGRDQR
ncbi:undecaprenyldiphospho-muramoylpentapeptide beta-N-acetylglucosaminyltransferase [Salimicrobium flavidum]|uniref:UDP-N-acetylglucosamine--N-acetylmuramyl-(pentapeptide) pyrophosphoryl-undecaprenol N-acetylglucosamine transferase n=1 Tax=Salimicrobium flavidum TaxID=570947 RepID=A0A1N7JCX3_9BACI|nr:undecaprenyldiphospho-muramoylpentapeptide beta-N-acetylglucosaminyltransferase [Salimicrobium flavidum]SIS47101.1 UDP-N-acetylglucosamine-N-acetylmuramylpentapeptide N-acetylglucosamine transferase [Salimicrobium flavidum]